MTATKRSTRSVVIVIASIAATGGLLFGFDTGVISGAIPFLQDYFELTDSQIENLTAWGLIGAVVGATASVYKNVEPWVIVGGNPAKFIKQREINAIQST